MDDLSSRLRAVCNLQVADVREYSGRHEYDGKVQDLSIMGVRRALTDLATAADEQPLADSYDEAQLQCFIRRTQVEYGDLELHRSNPAYHLLNLDLACYDRDYAPQAERDVARREHLAAWPAAIDWATQALDRVNAPVAQALLSAVAGLAAGLPEGADEQVRRAALEAHARLMSHLERAAAEGDPDPALGSAALSLLMGSSEATEVDLGRLAESADAERDRLMARLADSCGAIEPGRPPLDLARELVRDHPDADGVLDAARRWTQLVIDFTREHDLVPYHDGECLVGLAPESRRFAMAMMSPAGPGSPKARRGTTSRRPNPRGRRPTRKSGSRSSARPRCRGSPRTKWLPATSRMAVPSGA